VIHLGAPAASILRATLRAANHNRPKGRQNPCFHPYNGMRENWLLAHC
jgi:hypothetical protein